MSESTGQRRIAISLAIVAFLLAAAALVVAIARRGGSEAVPDARPVAIKPPPADARAFLVDRTHGVVPRQLVDELIADPSRLGTAREKPGVGFEITSIARGGVLEQLGFHEGDVIRGVNGMEVTTPASGLQIYQQLKSSTRFTIDLDRAGSALQLMVEIR
jgi:S1-C subfamily serine protease